jgi:hypothetical protein
MKKSLTEMQSKPMVFRDSHDLGLNGMGLGTSNWDQRSFNQAVYTSAATIN